MVVVRRREFPIDYPCSHKGAAGFDRVVVSEEPCNDVAFLPAVERAVSIRVQGDAKDAAADWIDARNAVDENVVDNLCLDKGWLIGSPQDSLLEREGCFSFLPQVQAETGAPLASSELSKHLTMTCGKGNVSVNDCNPDVKFHAVVS